jgi:hypothetical protein
MSHLTILLNILPSHMCTDVGYALFMESGTNPVLYSLNILNKIKCVIYKSI